MSGGGITNYQRLQNNKRETSTTVSNYLTRSPDAASLSDIQASANNIVKSATGSFAPSGDSYDEAKDMYGAAIQNLNEARDARHGIAWHKSGPHSDDSHTLVRDARSVINADKLDGNSPESYVMNYLNLARGAEVMLDQASEPSMDTVEILRARNQTRAKATKLMETLNNPAQRADITQDTFIHLTTDLVSSLSSLKKRDGTNLFNNAKGTLDRAKALTAMDDMHFHTSTLSTQKDASGKDRVVVENEIMALGTTKELSQQFKDIAKNPNTTNHKWYNVLDAEKKKLVQKYANDLAAGNKVVSSQLFNFIPGLKNAYMKVVEVSKTNGTDERDVVLESFHSGTPTYAGTGDREKGTKDTAELARTFVTPAEGAEVDFALHTLNSGQTPSKKYKAERIIVNELLKFENSKENNKGTAVDVAPVNIFRLVSKSRHEFSRKTLEKFGNLLEQKSDLGINDQSKTSLVNFIKNGETRPWYKVWKTKDRTLAKRALTELSKKSPELSRAVNSAMRLRGSIDRSSIGFLRKNNFRITTESVVVDHNMKVLGDQGEHKRLVFCKSGKDRTGAAEFKATHLAVSDHLGLTEASKEKGSKAEEAKNAMKHNISVLAGASSTQFMAGVQGGTVGAHGILPYLPIQVLDKSVRSATNLDLKTSKVNKVKTSGKVKTKSARKIIEDATSSLKAPSATPDRSTQGRNRANAIY